MDLKSVNEHSSFLIKKSVRRKIEAILFVIASWYRWLRAVLKPNPRIKMSLQSKLFLNMNLMHPIKNIFE